MSSNRTELTGSLSERSVLRHTPAGIPVIEFRVVHVSEQMEAGQSRQVDCELACVAVGTVALLLKDAAPGTALKVEGFLAARSLRQRTPVLHATAIEFEESICTN